MIAVAASTSRGGGRVVGRRRGARGGPARIPDTALVALPVVLVTVFTIGPVLLAVYFSLTNWDGFSLRSPFVGLQNYRQVFQDASARSAVLTTVKIAVACTVIVTLLALVLASMLRRPRASSGVYRGVFFYPHMIAAIAIGFAWNALLSPSGAINTVAHQLGLGPFPFLLDPQWAVASVVGVVTWQSTALGLVLFVSAMQAVPDDLYESATLDGAGAVQQFRWITVPSISGTITAVMVLNLAAYLRIYELILAMTQGGPAGSTQTIAYQILSVAYVNDRLGKGTAEAVLLFVATMILSLVIIVARRKGDEPA